MVDLQQRPAALEADMNDIEERRIGPDNSGRETPRPPSMTGAARSRVRAAD